MISKLQIWKNKDKGMTLPELILAMAMMTTFTAVFVVVMQFISRFFQPQNISIDSSSEKELKDILNDHMQINDSFDYIEDFLSQPGGDGSGLRQIIIKQTNSSAIRTPKC